MSKRWASFVSGGGTTMAAILDAIVVGRLVGIAPALIVATSEDIGAINKAKQRISEHGSKLELRENDIVIADLRKSSWEVWRDGIVDACQRRGVEVITQNGWFPKTPTAVIAAVNGNIFNQHPGPLDPGRKHDFGGGGHLGMYGRRVHCARLLFARRTEGNNWTEATSHVVTEEVDKGLTVRRRIVEILPDDTVETLQQRVLPVEHQVQIDTLQMFANGTIAARPRKERLIRKFEVSTLFAVKSAAVDLYPFG